MKNSKYLEISQEVRNAIENGKPVVALESTIITHGMPYPQNVQTAKQAEQMVRAEGAVPATIAIIKGKIKVGLTAQEIDYLGKEGMKVAKASVRDIAEIVAKGLDGSTTVSATMAVASMAGIKVLATGGIGGVHRGAETTMDISADLNVLGRLNMLVVCSGPKSILDLGLTREYLETQGIPVIGYGTEEMPAFYCRESGYKVDYRMDSPDELATALKVRQDLGVSGSILVTNPVPQNQAMSKASADLAIDKAVKAASDNGITGKELTPFLLALVKEMTGGMSLDANVALMIANADLAAKVAVSYAAMDNGNNETDDFDMLRAEIADDTAESIGKEIAALKAEMENTINQKLAGAPMPFMNPYMNPYSYQQMPNPYQAAPQSPMYQQPFQGMPNPYQVPPVQQPAQPAAPVTPQPAPYVNPYKPERPVEETVEEPVPQAPHFEPIPDEKWVNPFAPKREDAAEEAEPETVTETAEDANVIARPSEEVMQMVEDTVAEANENTENIVEEVVAETAEEATEEVPEETTEETTTETTEEPAKEEAAETAEDDGTTMTEYVPPVHEKKQRKPDNQVKQETDSEGMTSYDPEFYKKRAAERKARIAEAAGEAKHVEEEKAAEPEYVDCKGPLEFTGEHPWAWKCTRCGQLFQKHEIPHKCIKTE